MRDCQNVDAFVKQIVDFGGIAGNQMPHALFVVFDDALSK